MKRRFIPFLILFIGSVLLMAADGSWLGKVPEADRKRINPYAGQAGAAAAGRTLFMDNCAKCHGDDARGRHNRPSLRSERVEHATDGELAWILRNGSTWKGMPSWSSLPEPERWQIIAYLRGLPPDSVPATTGAHKAFRPAMLSPSNPENGYPFALNYVCAAHNGI